MSQVITNSIQQTETKIEFDQKAQNLIESKKIDLILLDIEYIEETCTQIFNPIIKIISSKNPGWNKIPSEEEIEIYNTPKFFKVFKIPPNLIVSTEGLFRKRLMIRNIEPIIKNVCKI